MTEDKNENAVAGRPGAEVFGDGNREPDVFGPTNVNERTHCGNCGVKLEPDPPVVVLQLKLRASLYGNDSIYVGDALSEVFKTKFPEEILEDVILCPSCSMILKDLYVIWNSFVSRTSSTGSLYQFLKDEASTQDSNLTLPEKPQRRRLKAKIARRTQVGYLADGENGRRRSKRKLDEKGSSENGKEDFSSSKFHDHDNGGLDFDDDRISAEGGEEETAPPPFPPTKGLPEAKRSPARRRGRRKKAANAVVDQRPVLKDDCETLVTKRPLRRHSVQTWIKIESILGLEDEVETESDDKDGGSDFDPDGMEDAELAHEKRLRCKRLIQKDKATAAKERRQNKHISKPVICTDCGKRFRSTNGLTRHQLSIHFNIHGPYLCKIETCAKKFSDQKSLESHMNNHLGLKPFICDQCGWATTGENLLRSHLIVHLKPEEKEELKRKICEVCGAKFIKSRDLSAHLIVHSDVKAFHCTYAGCEAKFKLRTKLNLHEKEVHLDTATKYPCLRCGRVFNRKHNLKLHMDRHMKYDLIGKGMRKSRDPPIRDKKFKKNVSIIEEPRGNEASNSLSAPPPDLLLYPPQFLSHP